MQVPGCIVGLQVYKKVLQRLLDPYKISKCNKGVIVLDCLLSTVDILVLFWNIPHGMFGKVYNTCVIVCVYENLNVINLII